MKRVVEEKLVGQTCPIFYEQRDPKTGKTKLVRLGTARVTQVGKRRAS